AIFLDAGLPAAEKAIVAPYGPALRSLDPLTLDQDAATLLQEGVQRGQLPLPDHSVVATHVAAHSQMVEVEWAIPKLQVRVLGSGASRRAAEQGAARRALEAAQAAMPAERKRARARGDAPAAA